ncbi:MAG: cytochrome c-type biogenesis protein CcmH [Candidatus Nitrospinota bacterium M3_3B_026]
MKKIVFALSFVGVLLFMSGKYIFLNQAPEKSVMGISHDLACPCECPMVLEDCHMSCGLKWKDQIGAKLKVGLKKEDIVSYFYKRYGGEALLTPTQRLSGKWYQLSRGGYPVRDMVLFALITLVWTALVYTVAMMVVEKVQTARTGGRS